MTNLRISTSLTGILIGSTLAVCVTGTQAQTFNSGGARGFSGPGAAARSFGSGGSVIGDGAGGFSIYSPSGTSRYLGTTPPSGRVYHPDGSSSSVIEDGAGNLNIYGPQGTHKAYGKSETTPSQKR